MKVELLFLDNSNNISISDVKSILEEIPDVSVDQYKISFEENHIPYELNLSANKKYVHLTLNLNGKNKNNASVLSKVKDLIRKGKHRAGYQIVISYDESSMYFNKKLFSFISEHESRLRQLIYLILIDTFGSTWVEETLNEEQQAELKSNLRGNKLIERGLEAFSYHEYITFLFNQRPNKFTNDFIDSTIEQIELAKVINKNELLAFLRDNKSSSLWETSFSELDYIEAENDIIIIRDIRNGVMHNKEVSTKDFDTNKQLIRESNRVLNQAVEYIKSEHSKEIRPEEVLISLQETLANIGTEYSALIEPISEVVKTISESIAKVQSFNGFNIAQALQNNITNVLPTFSNLYKNTGVIDSFVAMQNIQQRYIDLIPKLNIPEINLPNIYFNHDLMEMYLSGAPDETLEDGEVSNDKSENNENNNNLRDDNSDSNVKDNDD